LRGAYVLMGCALAADVSGEVSASAVSSGLLQQLSAARVDAHVTDQEMLRVLHTASGRHS